MLPLFVICLSYLLCQVHPLEGFDKSDSIHFPTTYEENISRRYKPTKSISISRKKCFEYAEAVNVTVESPILVDGASQTEKVDTCGISYAPLIVNGEDALPKEFPHMALIGHGDHPILWLCGGSLISHWWILSAAHCTATVQGTLAKWALLGDLKVLSDDDDDSSRPVMMRIVNWQNHPLYDRHKAYNDIALYKLEKKVEFNPYVRPICLHFDTEIKENEVIASGWGDTFYKGNASQMLQKVVLDVIKDTKNCDAKYKTVKNSQLKEKLETGINGTTMFCSWKKGKDTCQGDSGGPLQIRLKEPYCMYSIVGITSFGQECATEYPGVYTRVSHYIPWIEGLVWPENLGKNREE